VYYALLFLYVFMAFNFCLFIAKAGGMIVIAAQEAGPVPTIGIISFLICLCVLGHITMPGAGK